VYVASLISLVFVVLTLTVVPFSISNHSVSALPQDASVIHNGYWLADVNWDDETNLEPGILREIVSVEARHNLEGESTVQFGKVTVSTNGDLLEGLSGSLTVEDENVHGDSGDDIFTINKQLTEASVTAKIDVCPSENYLNNGLICAEDDVVDTVTVDLQWHVQKEDVHKDVVRESDRFDDGSWFRAYDIFHDLENESAATVTGHVEGGNFDRINIEDSPNISISRLQHREFYCASDPASICEIRLGG